MLFTPKDAAEDSWPNCRSGNKATFCVMNAANDQLIVLCTERDSRLDYTERLPVQFSIWGTRIFLEGDSVVAPTRRPAFRPLLCCSRQAGFGSPGRPLRQKCCSSFFHMVVPFRCAYISLLRSLPYEMRPSTWLRTRRSSGWRRSTSDAVQRVYARSASTAPMTACVAREGGLGTVAIVILPVPPHESPSPLGDVCVP